MSVRSVAELYLSKNSLLASDRRSEPIASYHIDVEDAGCEASKPSSLWNTYATKLYSLEARYIKKKLGGISVVLGRLQKPEPKPPFFGKTEPKRNRGFRRPNRRFGFGGSAYMVLVTVRVFVTGL